MKNIWGLQVHMETKLKDKVYTYLQTIPKGRVTTYGKIAEALGNKSLSRVVGNILHVNPDGDKYPCYKVVNSNGMLSKNYAFGGLEAQKIRLEADGITVTNDRVDLTKYLLTSDKTKIQK